MIDKNQTFFISYLHLWCFSGHLLSFYASTNSKIFTQFFVQLCFVKPIQALSLKSLNTLYAYFCTWSNTHSVEHCTLSGNLFVLRASGSIKKKKKKHNAHTLAITAVKNMNVKMSVSEFYLYYVCSTSIKPLSGRHKCFIPESLFGLGKTTHI